MENEDPYTYQIVEAVLRYWEDICSIKENVTSTCIPNYASQPDSNWQMKEGNTLQNQASKTTRVAHNTNKFSETLSCWTADIELAIGRMLDQEEYDNLMEMVTMPESLVTSEMQKLGSESIEKLLVYLNR